MDLVLYPEMEAVDEPKYLCEQCNKCFVSPSKLKFHMRTHSGGKPFVCNECSKSFAVADTLKKHMRTHSGEKPFVCKECSKSFSVAASLTTHLRTHSGEKTFVCKECSKSFSHAGNLKTHTTYESTFWTETICSQGDHLKKHMRIHYETSSSKSAYLLDGFTIMNVPTNVVVLL